MTNVKNTPTVYEQAQPVTSALVSILIPAFNASKTILPALHSALEQTYSNLEIIVVDDGSVDQTAQLVRNFAQFNRGVTLLTQENKGVAVARNLALRHSRGGYIATLDADDLWHREKLSRQMSLMRVGSPETGLVYCYSARIDEAGRVKATLPVHPFRGDVYASLILHNFIDNMSSPLIRRTCLEEAGGFDETLHSRGAQGCEDLKVYLAIAKRWRFDVVPDFLTGYRVTLGAMSSGAERMARSWELVITEAEKDRPDLPPKLFRWSRGNFYRWLGFGCLHRRQIRLAAAYLTKAMIIDPVGTPWAAICKMFINRLAAFLPEPPRTKIGLGRSLDRVSFVTFAENPVSVMPFTKCEQRRIAYAATLSSLTED